MAEIKDSGARREFPGGGVRDIQDGKGRCDLLPLADVASFLSQDWTAYTIAQDPLIALDMYLFSKDEAYLLLAIHIFAKKNRWDDATAALEIAKHMEDGSRKYGERNWQKGIFTHCYLDSAVRHYLKWCRGDEDERHDRAFCWNLLCMVWTLENKPEYDDIDGQMYDGL